MSFAALVSMAAAAAVLVHCICAFNHMGIRTRHAVRAAYGLVSLVALAQGLGPLYGGTSTWPDAAMMVAFAVYLLVNQRKTYMVQGR